MNAGGVIERKVVQKKALKYDPLDGHIDEEVTLDLNNTGHV